MDSLLDQLKEHIPPLFAAKELDRLTGNALRWRTIQNIRANKTLSEDQKIPEDCFMKYRDKKILIRRDPFLNWWITQLSTL